ncbi:class III lanthionine synthetase LanKC [Actinomadura sp. DC4]|uniref:class III lanthionine synthetase LanKC n=1 Tax=Actinomadura sp. DC4 TaxID=3055069 RepID=UPI0025B07BC1|nr:class III lanthionine synthetase LanKC [Actinomadura sp. DC4]MDN3356334.1 class III lanthionine synthetase LanKC [Actinomadura sp. DC4]
MSHTLYTFADLDFYDSLEKLPDGKMLFEAASRPVPEGWVREGLREWIYLRPRDARLPDQGWKIHASARFDEAAEVIDIIWDHCVSHGVAFKFLRSRAMTLMSNFKYAHRGSSGKLVAIYPRDENELRTTLEELGRKLARFSGPYILSDLRWRDGPLHVRYGGFTLRYCLSEDGELLPAVEDPDGRLVPDERQPSFRVPSWVTVPGFIAAQQAADDASDEEFPYRVEEALHFSNAGGVYLADDLRSGDRVVLKEARPHAGLDRNGHDAVTRMAREERALRLLAGRPFVPRLVESARYWEHSFLAMEYVEGETLFRASGLRDPLISHSPDAREIAEYTEWVLHIVAQVEAALRDMHDAGLVYGDLHSSNVIVRPDDTIALVDFESSSGVSEDYTPGLAATGFAGPDSLTGFDVDEYALACLRLAVFLPLTSMMQWDPRKAHDLLDVIVDRFPVPADFAGTVTRGLFMNDPYVPRRRHDEPPDWDALFDSAVTGVLASATPGRRDRLFPGDIQQFRSGGSNLAYGAAGVLYALSEIGRASYPEFPDHVGWLVRSCRGTALPYAGFYNGLHGIAFALDRIGRRDEALPVFERALDMGGTLRTPGLFGGLAGAGLNVLYFAGRTGDRSLVDLSLEYAERLSRAVAGDGEHLAPSERPGLMYGFSGVALFFVRLFEATGDDGWLDLAATALRRDLEECKESLGGLYVREPSRILPYLDNGSGGVGVALHEYLRHRADPEFARVRDLIHATCRAEFVVLPGLFSGRTGLMTCLRHLGEGQDPGVDLHLRRMFWHFVERRGSLFFPGEGMLRLSTDLATGSAGVLLAIHTAVEGRPGGPLPFMTAGHPATAVLQLETERR